MLPVQCKRIGHQGSANAEPQCQKLVTLKQAAKRTSCAAAGLSFGECGRLHSNCVFSTGGPTGACLSPNVQIMSKTVGDSIVSINNGQLFRTLGDHDWGALVCFHHVAAVELAFHVCLARTQAGQNTVNRNITKPFWLHQHDNFNALHGYRHVPVGVSRR